MFCRNLLGLHCRNGVWRSFHGRPPPSLLLLHPLLSSAAHRSPPPLSSSSLLSLTTSFADTVLLYENPHTKSKFFRLIFVMSAVQLVFWAYLSYFAFVELRQDNICRAADQRTQANPPSPTTSKATKPSRTSRLHEETKEEGEGVVKEEEGVVKEGEEEGAPWYTSLRWRLGISLLALGMGVFFATTACMYPLRVVQRIYYVRGVRSVVVTTYTPFRRGTREVQAPLDDVALAGSRSDVKGRQVGMKVKGHRLFFLVDKEGTFPSPSLFDTLIGTRRC